MRLYIPFERPKYATVVFLACLIPFAVLAAHQWAYLPKVSDGDFAQYILHAKAIVEGRKYTDTGYIFTNLSFLVGPIAQPPGLPLLLAPLVAVFGPNLMILKSVVVLSTIAYALIAASYFGRRESLWVGAAVALLTTLALQTQHATISVIADLPFSAACWWLISLADREGAWTGYRAALVTILGGVAVMFRVAGVAAGIAVLIFALTRPKAQRRASSLPLLLWFIGSVVVMSLFSHFLPFAKQVLMLGQANIPRRAVAFVLEAKEAVLHSFLYPFPGDESNDIYHLIMLIPTIIGGIHFLVRYRRTFVWCFTLAYILMLALSPVQESRYLWPLYPILAYATVDGLIIIARAVLRSPALVVRAPVLTFGLILAIGTSATIYAFEAPPPPSLLGNADVKDLFAWLRAQPETRPQRVAFIHPRVLTLATGVPAMAPIFARTSRIQAEFEKKRINTVVLGDVGKRQPVDSVMEAFVRTGPIPFDPVYHNATFRVFRIRREPDRTRPGTTR